MRFFLPATILAAALAAGTPANATPIPPPDMAVYSGSLCFGFGSCPSILASPGVTVLGGSYLAADLTPSPSIQAFITGGTVVGSGNPVPATGLFQGNMLWNTAGYFAGLQYYAHITGLAGVALPIDLTYTLRASTTGVNSHASAGIYLNPSVHLNASAGMHPTYGVNADEIGTGISDANGLTPSIRSGTLTDTVLSNTEFDIGLLVGASTFSSTGIAFASVDPVLFIDPSFAAIDPNYLTDFTIELSPGAGNSEIQIPEPPSVAVLAAGLALLGFAFKRRNLRPRRYSV